MPSAALDRREVVRDRYLEVRGTTASSCEPLAIEDHVVQTMPDVSPPKWHLAHTTWFFETFVLTPFVDRYEPFHPRFDYLFNSYYETHGRMHPRPQRGLLSRPTVAEIRAYRDAVDARVCALIEDARERDWTRIQELLELGWNHEQQHQELLLIDIKHILWCNPLRPAYRNDRRPVRRASKEPSALRWYDYAGGVREFGHADDGFAYDNERPAHQALVRPFQLAGRCVTNAEYLAFMDDGGYQRPELWLADGWTAVREHGWRAPLYWESDGREWTHFTLDGMRSLCRAEPVVHVSYYEAEAFARWAGARLPSELEWELAAGAVGIEGTTLESQSLHPRPAAVGDRDSDSEHPAQLYGDVWEWTASPYAPYPGYHPREGSLGEYNGKFMCNQFVQRGGSCATTRAHLRPTYRNFFYPHQRWNFQGLRLARGE